MRHLLKLLSILLLGIFLPAELLAKRKAPKPVNPIVLKGIEYRAPLSVEKLGMVEAWDMESSRLLWEKQIYPVKSRDGLEQDAQWVFISGLSIDGGKLIVMNERGERFALDVETREVTQLKP